MHTAYYDVIVMLHLAFAAVFLSLSRQSQSAFTKLFALCWIFEAARAAILLDSVRAWGGSSEHWCCVSDVLCFVANWCLLAGCADLASIRLPRWLGPVYLLTGVPVVVISRFWFNDLVPPAWLAPAIGSMNYGVFINLIVMFVPVAVSRVLVVTWLFQLWRRSRLPGALIATVFSVPYAVVVLAVPLMVFHHYSPEWSSLLWCARVLGFSIGLVILMLNVQQVALAKSSASLVAAQSLAKIGSWEMDHVTNRASWSAEMFRLYGRDPALGVPVYDQFLKLIYPDDREEFGRLEDGAKAERRSTQREFRVVRPDGRVRWIQGRSTSVLDRANKLIRTVGVEQDITERKRAESRIELQHAVTRALAEAEPTQPTMQNVLAIIAHGLESNVGIIWSTDRATRTLRYMDSWERPGAGATALVQASRIATIGEGVGHPGMILHHRTSVFWAGASTRSGDDRLTHAAAAGLLGGTAFPVILRNEVLAVIEFFSVQPRRHEDETNALLSAVGTQLAQFIERQHLDEQYRQSQKMEAVGTLAGGIAHDFNNILTAISGYCELARLDLPEESVVHAHLEAVQQGATRATTLVRQIMAFSRRQEQSREPIRLESVVEEALGLLRATIPSTIEIRTHYEPNVPRVLADATSIHQIVVNLATNSSHAMKGRTGRLDVKVDTFDVSLDFASAHTELTPGPHVRLAVSDTGHGMSAATVARIFEPFFTTKAPGEGTGLGLSVVHGIMKSHEGTVLVYSQPGEGTEFVLYFPAHTVAKDTIAPFDSVSVAPGNGERVLYVDDEGPLGQMGRNILERLNYRVEVHNDPVTALSSFRANPDSYDLMLTDLTMPGMTGIELARQILQLRPELPVVLMTGYAATIDGEQARAQGIAELLLKPHSLTTLGLAVRRALHKATVPNGAGAWPSP
ncbi:MAG: ATP-binding protein [Opitutus sp.]